MVNYPTSLDVLTNPIPADPLTSVTVPHATQHANVNDIVELLEAKLGIGSSTPGASAGVLRRTGIGASAWGQTAAGDYGAGSIVNADVNAAAALALSKLAPGSSGVLKSNGTAISAGNLIVTADMASNTINADRLSDATIAKAKMAAGGAGSQGGSAVSSVSTTALAGSPSQIPGSGYNPTLLGRAAFLWVCLKDAYSTGVGLTVQVNLYDGAGLAVIALTHAFPTINEHKTVTAFHYVPTFGSGAHAFSLYWYVTGGTINAGQVMYGILELP